MRNFSFDFLKQIFFFLTTSFNRSFIDIMLFPVYNSGSKHKMLKGVRMMEQKSEGSYAAPWLEKRKQSSTDTIDDTDYWAMLQELSRGQQ